MIVHATANVSRAMAELAAARPGPAVYSSRRTPPSSNPAKVVWSNARRSLASRTEQNIDHLSVGYAIRLAWTLIRQSRGQVSVLGRVPGKG